MSSAQDKSNASGSSKELVYDPKSGMSKQEFEWRCSQYKMAVQRMPQLLRQLRIHSQRMRHHFVDDPDTLAKWARYEGGVHSAFESMLKYPITSHIRLPNSLLYKIHMKERSTKSLVSMLFGGLNKRVRVGAAAAVGVAVLPAAVGVAVGIAVLRRLLEPVESAED